MNKENQGASEMNPGNKKNSLKEVVADHDNTLYQLINDVTKLKQDQTEIKTTQETILKHLGLNQEVKK